MMLSIFTNNKASKTSPKSNRESVMNVASILNIKATGKILNLKYDTSKDPLVHILKEE